MPDEATKLRIFLADDHGVVREGLRTLINAQSGMEVIGEASDGPTVLEQAADCRPDIVVMDVSMPGFGGAAATARLRQMCPDVKVLALSMHEDKNYLRELLEAGASGYVLKRAAADDLIRAIRSVAAGGVYIDPALAGKIIGGLIGQPPSRGAIEGTALSERETDVLRLIARGYSNKEIAAQLSISIKTVETYKARSMEKLQLGSRVDIIRYALDRGWLQPS